ncbi:gamma-glutamyl-gamma-aminobutyrate hydrolase family protein [Nocardia sp. NPDC058640]|uniref:gamma-glutamyl-gamma-aminobutyrate hydrolase family protein n=1 Tax=Nocardia sp. NPDC058640 TaxID=3346571 RepID=UPI003649243D
MTTLEAPIIGISTYQEQASWRGWHRSASLVPTDFIDKIRGSGGHPILLPPANSLALHRTAERLIRTIDALLIVGGPDIDPHRNSPSAAPATSSLQLDRDAWEFELLQCALDQRKPFLGVCRGMQVLSVLLGGSLHQHLPDDLGTNNHQPAGANFGSNRIALDASREPGLTLGTSIVAPCYHHQAIDRLGQGLIVTGISSDGVIESIQLDHHDFVVGVQWHPEVMIDGQALFTSFVQVAHRGSADASTKD